MKYSNTLKRKKIYEELSIAITFPLSLIVAPMGYGKSVVVEEFFKDHLIEPIWLYFEMSEFSPNYIWDTFSRQLKSSNAKLGKLFETMGFPFTTPQRNHVFEIIESYAKEKHCYIVIDDYQFNQSNEIDEFIQLLVRAKISGLRLLLLSRTTPALNVTELILKKKCYRITEKYFMLSLAEVGKIFRLQKVHADNSIIEKTYKISEGWISAVLLLVHRYRETGSIDSVEDIEELIATTIMNNYTQDKKEIAVLGILESFSLEQLSIILGETTARRLINKLLKRGAFIRYNAKTRRYTIHNIFTKYLFNHEFTKLERQQQEVYYSLAGKWFVENGYIMEGIRCFLAAEKYELILKEFEKETIMKVFDYYPHYVCEIINQIPKQLTKKYPLAYLCYLHFLITAHDIHYGVKLLMEMESELKEVELIETYNGLKLQGEVEYLKSFITYNDVEKMSKHQKTAYEIIGGPSLTTRPDKMPCAGSYSFLYMYYKEKGSLEKVARFIYDNMFYYEKLSGREGTGVGNLAMAEYYLEIGDIEKAELNAKRGLIRAKQLPQFDSIISCTYILARCMLSKGKIEGALEVMSRMTEDASYEMTALFQSIRSPYFFAMDSIYLKTKQIEALSDALKSKNLDDKMLFFQSKALGYILYGQYLLHGKQYLELEVFCEEMKQLFIPFNNLLGYLNAYILESIACFHLYGIEKVKPILEQAFSIGKSDNIVTSFAEYGSSLKPLLEAYLAIDDSESFSVDRTYLALIVKKTQEYTNALDCYSNANEKVSLTSREMDILNLLSTGKRNIEIASELFVSESAVKKMLSSIYRKFGVKNRTGAIKAYEEKIQKE